VVVVVVVIEDAGVCLCARVIGLQVGKRKETDWEVVMSARRSVVVGKMATSLVARNRKVLHVLEAKRRTF
jgi:hypothetical protein